MLAAFLSVQALQAAEPIPAYITAVIADPSRPDVDRERDADRKPELVIAFAGVKPGDKVADFMPGRGYFTRLFCKLVGETGRVYAIDVAPATPAASPAPELAHACTNVTLTTLQVKKRPAPELWSASDDPGGVYEYWSFTPAAETFATPEPLDVIWIAESYHDLHNAAFGSPHLYTVHKALLAALRPGGVLVIEDHAASSGSGARDAQTLHRIDIELVKREVTAAGFEYVGATDVLHNRDDPHTRNTHEMRDATDRFLLKFRRRE